MEPVNKRNINLDIIRITAFFLVVLVHFFIGIAFYEQNIEGFSLFVLLVVRNTAMICVPLFLMLSGALLNKRTLCRKHYLGLIRIIAIYIFIAILSLCYKHFCLGTEFSIRDIFGSITNYYANDYSEFVTLYIALFILIPFINLAYNGLENQKQKLIFLITLFCVSHLYTLVNLKIHLYTFFFDKLYPVTYYVLGAYLMEYSSRKNAGKKAIYLACAVILFGIFNYLYCKGGKFDWPDFTNYDGFETFFVALLIFDLLISLDLPPLSERKVHFISCVSRATYAAFLLSWIVDDVIYINLRAGIPDIPPRNIWILAVVPVSFTVSLILGHLTERLLSPAVSFIKTKLETLEICK